MLNENIYLRHLREDRVRVPVRKDAPGTFTAYPGGEMKKTLDFLTEVQLTNREMWKTFVQQFRFNSDGDTLAWRCEYWGKAMRGAAYVYAVTHDRELFDVMTETVEDLLTTQDAQGRFSTYAPECEFRGWDLWGRKYVLLGLQKYSELCEDADLRARIMTAMCRHADYIVRHIGREAEGKRPISRTSDWHACVNSVSILEPMILLYEQTGKKEYLDFCTYLVEEGADECGGMFRLAKEDKLNPYQYPITKAYETMSCFEGLLEYARITNQPEWTEAVIRFAYRALETETSVIGIAGCMHEYFDAANLRQTSRFYEGPMQENCVTVTWMKFCARLLVLTGDPVFADAFEQSLENGYYGALNTERKANISAVGIHHYQPGVGLIPTLLPFDSYSPLLRGTRATAISGLQSFLDGTYYSCCSCIAGAAIGIAPQLSVLRAENGFAVELYTDTVVQKKTDDGTPVAFCLTGGYPANDSVKLTVCPAAPAEFDLALRIPSWSRETILTLNGETVPVTPGMTVLHRVWNHGDIIRITFDFSVEALRPAHYGSALVKTMVPGQRELKWLTDTEKPEYFAYAALRRGPMILARDARIGEGLDPVALPLDGDKDTVLNATERSSASLPFPTRCRMEIPTSDGGSFTVVDYSSVGKTWDKNSECEAWIPLK